MAETFKDLRDFEGRASIAYLAFTAALGKVPHDDAAAIGERARADGGAFSVEFMVNGVPLPFSAFVDAMNGAYDGEVAEKVARALVDRATDLRRKLDAVNEVLDGVVSATRDAVKAEFPEAARYIDEGR